MNHHKRQDADTDAVANQASQHGEAVAGAEAPRRQRARAEPFHDHGVRLEGSGVVRSEGPLMRPACTPRSAGRRPASSASPAGCGRVAQPASVGRISLGEDADVED